MASAQITGFEGRAIPLPGNDIDTDRIIPARFMKCVTFEGLGKYAFYDARFDADGNEKSHPFNDTSYQGGCILLAGRNFGCGSSREHAPQALMRYGIKAIIAESFAEIFAGNCTTMGIPVATAPASVVQHLRQLVTEAPETVLKADLETLQLFVNDHVFKLEMPPTRVNALVSGTWDTLNVLLENPDVVRETYERLPYVHWK